VPEWLKKILQPLPCRYGGKHNKRGGQRFGGQTRVRVVVAAEAATAGGAGWLRGGGGYWGEVAAMVAAVVARPP
jgi:hypothetical protein